MSDNISERTLVLLKPDAVQRSLVGKIISRFEDLGLKLVAMKLIQADDVLAEKHYPLDEEWAKAAFEKTKASAEADGKTLEYSTPKELGEMIQSGLVNFLKESPVVAIVFEGPHAIELIRKTIGSTEPRKALPGTIRSDFASVESYAVANPKKRAVRNLIHASDSPENAEKEISTWFSEQEIFSYEKDLDKHF
jgi:nucleoside-diphosphate kinase